MTAIRLDAAAADTAAAIAPAREPADLLLDVIASMTEANGVESALHRLARLALDAIGGDRCAIFVRQETSGGRLVPTAAATRVGDPEVQWRRFRDMESVDIDENLVRKILLESRDVIVIDDAAASPVIPPSWLREWRSRSAALAPLRSSDTVYGVLAIDYVDEAHAFTPAEVGLLRSIGAAASLALRDAQLIEQVQQRALLEQQLTNCVAILLSGRSTRDVLGSLADAFGTLLPGTSFAINLISADKQSFRPVAWRGSRPVRNVFRLADLPELDVKAIQAAWMRQPNRPITIDDLRGLPHWQDVIPVELDVGMMVPLTDGSGVIGWISAGRAGTPFTPEEVRVATVFAGQAAVAVNQAALRDASAARLRVIDTLSLLGNRAGKASNPRRLIAALNRDLTEGLGLRCERLAVDGQLLAQALRLPELTKEERTLLKGWRASPEPLIEDARIAVPVNVGERVSGVLWLTATAPPDATTISLASAVAAAIGDVAWKAKLRRKSERRAVELALSHERERIAHDLHDTVGQIFYSMGLRLHDAVQRATEPDLRETLAVLREHASAGMHEVRTSVYAQSFLRANRTGLAASVREIAQRFALATGVFVDVRITPPLGRIAPDVTRALTRIVHEVFVNVERHARASLVVVTLSASGDDLCLAIRDDGVGLPLRTDDGWQGAAGFGMRSMAKSVRDLGGTFTAESVEPIGLRIVVSVPRRGPGK